MSGSGSHRQGAERRELLLDWFRSCEGLRDALLMPVGSIPRQWSDKLRLARRSETLLAEVVEEWSLQTTRGENDAATLPSEPRSTKRGS